MGHAYKLLFIFRPFIWFLVAMLVVAFGRCFLKKLLNGIAIFLFLLSIGGSYVLIDLINKVADPYYFATTDEWSQVIVGSVTLTCFLISALGYFLIAQTVEGKDGKVSKHANLLKGIVSWMFACMIPFAVMGYCLPFFLLDSIAGIIVGAIGEVLGFSLLVFIVCKKITGKNGKDKNGQEEQIEQNDAT